jgi:trehalose 6-phosphate synthase
MSRTTNGDRATLIVAANRGPVSISVGADGEDRVERGGGGLVTGMQAALADSPGAVWVCAAMSARERVLAREAAGRPLSLAGDGAAGGDGSSDLPDEFGIVMLGIDALTFRQAYDGIANATLWFVLHMLFEPARRPLFDAAWRRQWSAYRRYNEAFAAAIAEQAADGATVMVQDYHLFLLPALLRRQRPDLRISLFTHTPWVTADYFRMLPDDVATDLLEGMLGADLLGFHTHRWAEQFRECCVAVLGRKPDSRVEIFGLTTDADELRERAAQRDVQTAARELRTIVGDRLVVGRVDRTELSKNVLRGLLAYRELLRGRPEWLGQVVHLVFDYPSRENLPEYREYTAALERLAGEIEEEFGTDEWSPLDFRVEQDYAAALAALGRSDVIFVNSLRDGMNLVVLEAIILADHDPVVVLSRETGAAELLGDDAVLINPYDVSQTAEALHQALTAVGAGPSADPARAQRLRAAATGLPPVRWFQAQLDSLGA